MEIETKFHILVNCFVKSAAQDGKTVSILILSGGDCHLALLGAVRPLVELEEFSSIFF